MSGWIAFKSLVINRYWVWFPCAVTDKPRLTVYFYHLLILHGPLFEVDIWYPKLVFSWGKRGKQKNIFILKDVGWLFSWLEIFLCCYTKAQANAISLKLIPILALGPVQIENLHRRVVPIFIEFLPDFWLSLVHCCSIRTPHCALSLLPQDSPEYGIMAHYSFIRLTHSSSKSW